MAKAKKKKKKLNRDQRRANKAVTQKDYEWVFMNGKQVRVKKEPMIDGMSIDEFIENNADPIWLHQNGMWEYIKEE